MRQVQDTREVAEELLRLQLLMQPSLNRMEELKDRLRGAVVSNGNEKIEQIVAGLGAVTAAAACERKLKGTEDLLVLERWLDLPEAERARLKTLGVVKTEKVFTQARKSAVSVKLDAKVVASVNDNTAAMAAIN